MSAGGGEERELGADDGACRLVWSGGGKAEGTGVGETFEAGPDVVGGDAAELEDLAVVGGQGSAIFSTSTRVGGGSVCGLPWKADRPHSSPAVTVRSSITLQRYTLHSTCRPRPHTFLHQVVALEPCTIM